MKLQVKDQIIQTSSCVKYLGVYLDRNLTFQNEIKNILRKMATGIKVLYNLQNIFPEKTKLLLLNALVISHLHYSAILLGGIRDNLITILEKQLNWGIKACFNRTKYERSSDLKKRHNTLPVRFLLDLKTSTYFYQWKNGLVPAFRGKLEPSTAQVMKQQRTNLLYFRLHTNTKFMDKCFFKRAIQIWNTLPKKIKNTKYTYLTVKKKMKTVFVERFKSTLGDTEHGEKHWIDYRFK